MAYMPAYGETTVPMHPPRQLHQDLKGSYLGLPIYNNIRVSSGSKTYEKKSVRRGSCYIFISILVLSNLVTNGINWYFTSQYYVRTIAGSNCGRNVEEVMNCAGCSREQVAERGMGKPAGSGRTTCCVLNIDLFKEITNSKRNERSDDQDSEDEASSSHGLTPAIQPARNQPRNTAGLFFLDNRPIDNKLSKNSNNKNEDYQPLTSWSLTPDISFKGKSLTLNQTSGSIKVTESGFYVVFAHVQFLAIKGGSSPHRFGLRLNMGNGRDYIENTEIRSCDTFRGEVAPPCHSSQVFSVVYLQDGAELSLDARPVSLISDELHASYFSIYKL